MFGIFKKTQKGSTDIAAVGKAIEAAMGSFQGRMVNEINVVMLAQDRLSMVPKNKLPFYDADILAFGVLCAAAHEYSDNGDVNDSFVMAMAAGNIEKKFSGRSFSRLSQDNRMLFSASQNSLHDLLEELPSKLDQHLSKC